jgi:hypothetical protein
MLYTLPIIQIIKVYIYKINIILIVELILKILKTMKIIKIYIKIHLILKTNIKCQNLWNI